MISLLAIPDPDSDLLKMGIITPLSPTRLLFQSSNSFFLPLLEAAFILWFRVVDRFAPVLPPLSKLIKAHR